MSNVTLALIAFLEANDAPASMILGAVKTLHEANLEDMRSAYEISPAAERTRRWRAKKASQVTSQKPSPSVTSDEPETPSKVPPITPLNTTPSEANASAADAAQPIYTDSTHELWGEGTAILGQLGVPAKAAKPNIGRWLKATGDPVAVLGAIQRARDNRIIDPIPWITAALPSKGQWNGRPEENSLVAAGKRRLAELDRYIADEADAGGGAEGEDSLRAGNAAVLLLPQRGRGVG